MGHITDQYGPYYSPIWAILQAHPCPSPREGSVDGWGKYGLKGQNKSAQGNALGIVHNQHSPRMGKRIIIPFTPFATLQWWAVILLPPSGAYPCCILSPGISMPLRGVTNTHPLISDRRTKGHNTPSLWEGRGGLLHHLLGRGAVRPSHKAYKTYNSYKTYKS